MAVSALSLVRSLAAMVIMLAMAVGHVDGLSITDTITWGGDNSRSGYFPNNNMDPAVVNSSDFGQVFKVQLPGIYNGEKERIFSQPLIYTPKNGDGTQYVYWATAQNNVYKMNAKTGEIVAKRNLHIPFMSQDLKGENQQTPGYCQDINPTVGIIGTGVIDPDTDTLYLSAKTYEDQSIIEVPQGRPAGRIYIHALDVNNLKERPNFPINLEGLSPRNNPERTFNGGIQNQRPGLLHPKGSNFIYAGFGSHCVNYNFTGYVIGWHKTTGEIVERFATQGEGVDSPKKGASLWMSGGGIASDDKGSMFFSTGNGYSGQVKDIPISGRTPPTSLEEAVVHMTYNSTGQTSVVDFFMPANKGYLDGGDLDLGTSPLAILPSTPFSCGDTKRIGVVTGKDGNTWFLNLDDLGGYKQAVNKGNRVIGSYLNENSVYAGVGVYPLDGGYVYVNVIGFKSHVFKFNCVNGVPAFTKTADSPAGKNGFGVSHGAVTSYKNQPGSGLFWVTDVDNAIPEKWSFRIYEAVPSGAGGTVMKILKGWSIPAINKFTRPHFGNGIVYFGTSEGVVYAFGAPVNPALDCTTVDDFDTTNVGVQADSKTVTCTAKGDLTVKSLTLESADFTVASTVQFPLVLAATKSFTFTASFKPTKVGVRSGSVVIKTANNVGGFSTTTSVGLKGTGESSNALLTISPSTVEFSQLVVGSASLSNTVVLANDGKPVLNVESIRYSTVSPEGPYVDATETDTETTVGLFSLTKIPTQLAPQSQKLVTVTFKPTTVGNYTLYVNIKSDGGSKAITVTGSVGQSPTALIQLEKPDGSGWQTWDPKSNKPLSFGNVTQNNIRKLRFRITNTAPVGSVALQIPISKPPFGVPGLINTVNQADLGEGSIIPAGGYLEAVIFCSAPKVPWNTDSYSNIAAWIFNTNDATLGKFEVPFTCTATAQQGGPLADDGQGIYRYVGCFRENNPGRQLQSQLYGNNNNTADMCLKACAAKGFTYCGTQYHRECWGGNKIPNQQVAELNCNFDCSGDIGQYCGGDGVGSAAGNAHISLFATNKTIPNMPAPGGPYVNPGLGGYTSIGCWTEVSGRTLPNGVSTNNVKTVAACINACGKLNYKYIGLEYGGECWCGNELRSPSAQAKIGDCNTVCKDNTTEYCGGGSRLNVYQFGVLPSSSSSSVLSSTSVSSTSTVVALASAASSGSSVPAVSTSSSSSLVSDGVTSTSTVSTTSSELSASTSSASSSVSSSEVIQSTSSAAVSSSSTSDSSSSVISSTSSSVDSSESSSTASTSSTSSTSSEGSSSTSSTESSSTSSTEASSTSSIETSSSTSSAESSSTSSEEPSSTSSVESSSISSTAISSTSALTSSSESSTSVESSTSTTASTTSLTSSVGSSTSSSADSSASSTSSVESSTSTPASSTLSTESLPSSTQSATSASISDVSSSTETSTSSTSDKPSSTSSAESTASLSSTSTSSYSSTSDVSSISVGSSTLTASSSSSSVYESTLVSSTSSTSSSTSTSISSTISSTSSAVSSSSSSSSSTSSMASSSTSTSSFTTTRTSTTSSSAVPSFTPPPGNSNFTYYGCVVEPSNGRLLSRLVFGRDDLTQAMCLEACYMYDYAGLEFSRECWCGKGPINWNGTAGATPGFNTTNTECNRPCAGNTQEKCGGTNKRMTLFYRDFNKTKSVNS